MKIVMKQLLKKYSNDTITTNIITSENPLIKPTYSHSTSYKTNQMRTTNINHSRDSSPVIATNSDRSLSPTSGYASSGFHPEGILHDSISSSSAYVPQHDYINVVDRHPSSSKQNERTPSALNEFVSKTNNLPSPSSTGGKYSIISALVKP